MMEILWPAIVLGGLGLLFGLLLTFASKKFHVEKDPRIGEIRNVLPGANCGGCGYAGCDALAEAIAKGEAPVNKCPVGGAAVAGKVAEIMGVEASEEVRKVCHVRCHGVEGNVKDTYKYQGIRDCQAVNDTAGGGKACRFACLGLGNCERACQFDAIKIVNGIPKVNTANCTACGVCVATCPRSVLELLPENTAVFVACRNTSDAKTTRAACTRGCIACKRCVKACEQGAIEIVNNVATIDYSKCIGCGACAEVCPSHCMTKDEILINVEKSKFELDRKAQRELQREVEAEEKN